MAEYFGVLEQLRGALRSSEQSRLTCDFKLMQAYGSLEQERAKVRDAEVKATEYFGVLEMTRAKLRWAVQEGRETGGDAKLIACSDQSQKAQSYGSIGRTGRLAAASCLD